MIWLSDTNAVIWQFIMNCGRSGPNLHIRFMKNCIHMSLLGSLLEFYPMNDVRFMQFFHSQLMDNWGFSASAATYSVLWRYHSSIKVMCLLKSFQHSRCKFLIQVLLSVLLWSSLFIVIDILLWVGKQNLAMIFDLPGCTFLQCRDAVSTNPGIAVSKSSIKKW